jgi:hypothetical protein
LRPAFADAAVNCKPGRVIEGVAENSKDDVCLRPLGEELLGDVGKDVCAGMAQHFRSRLQEMGVVADNEKRLAHKQIS